MVKVSTNYVLIVCSTSTKQEKGLKKILEQEGYNFITEYMQDNHEIYQLADYYVFPTKDKFASIEFPLSVFEALSCGIPVFYRNFGALRHIFNKSYTDIKSYHDAEGLLHCNFSNENKFPIDIYSWENSVKDLIEKLQ